MGSATGICTERSHLRIRKRNLTMSSFLLYAACFLVGVLVSRAEGAKHSYQPVGCYQDRPDRIFPNLHATDGTIEGCFNAAVKLGLEMFAVQNGGECWLDETKNNDYNKHGSSNVCKGGAGGPWANSVYRIRSFCHRQTVEGLCCVFPFIYNKKTYHACTTDGGSEEWCSTTTDYDTDKEWGQCSDPCKPGWRYFKNQCYKVYDKRVYGWHTARRKCLSQDADLAMIKSEAENHFLKELVPRFINAWIGVRRGADSKFYYVDGKIPTFVNWAPGEPNDATLKEHCAEMRANGEWNDVNCSHRLAAVCKKGF